MKNKLLKTLCSSFKLFPSPNGNNFTLTLSTTKDLMKFTFLKSDLMKFEVITVTS